MSSDTPDLDIASSQLELEFLTANNVFQIPEGYDQPLMFSSTGLNFDNNSSGSSNNTNSGDVALDTNNPATTTAATAAAATSTSTSNSM